MPALHYAGSAVSLSVSLITTWERGEIPELVMSTSSGPKDYLKNAVWLLFNSHPQIERVALVRSTRSLFFLMRASGSWFDVTGKPVVGLE